MTIQELANRMRPRREDYMNEISSLGKYFNEEGYNYALNLYNEVLAGNQAVIDEWTAFYEREARKSAAKKEREKSFQKDVQDNLTSIAKELGVTKKLLIGSLKKDQKIYNAVRFKGFRELDTIKSLL